MLIVVICLSVAACLLLAGLTVATIRGRRKPAPEPRHRKSREPYRPRRLYGIVDPPDDTEGSE